MFTAIRAGRQAAPVMCDLGERGRRNEQRWRSESGAVRPNERNQPAAERAEEVGVEWSHLGRTAEPVKGKISFGVVEPAPPSREQFAS